ncbi:MAG: hypothetical protein R2748_13325 [Bryobacterales bacterium]
MRETERAGLPMFLEPLPIERTDAGFRVVKSPEALAKIVGVASALGESSRRLWLKLPYCEGYERKQWPKATTLPILLLGGESAGNIGPFVEAASHGCRRATGTSAGAGGPECRCSTKSRRAWATADPLGTALAAAELPRRQRRSAGRGGSMHTAP